MKSFTYKIYIFFFQKKYSDFFLRFMCSRVKALPSHGSKSARVGLCLKNVSISVKDASGTCNGGNSNSIALTLNALIGQCSSTPLVNVKLICNKSHVSSVTTTNERYGKKQEEHIESEDSSKKQNRALVFVRFVFVLLKLSDCTII